MKKVLSILFCGALLFLIGSCKSFVAFQSRALYDVVPPADSNEIEGFTATTVFGDDMDKSVWASPERQCVQLTTEQQNVFSGKSSLKVTWDKIEGGCKWVGIGFGWNNWMAKDMISISKIAAIQMKIKSVKGSFSNLPVAFAFEDYSGVQCYYGYRAGLASGEFNDTAWTTVTIPLVNFPFERQGFDLEKVKQFIIQLEGDGNIYLDNIKLIKI